MIKSKVQGPDHVRQGLSFSTADVLGWIILCCPVYYRIFSNIPGHYPLDISSNLLPSCANQTNPKNKQKQKPKKGGKKKKPTWLQTLLDVPWGQKQPCLRATWKRLNFNLLATGSHVMILSIGSNTKIISFAFHMNGAVQRWPVEGQVAGQKDEAD